MSQTTTINPNPVVCVPVSPSHFREAYCLADSDDDSVGKQSHRATDNLKSEDGSWKASLKSTLTKTRNWMAHIFSWQSVKAFFEKAFTKTSDVLDRLFSPQNIENAAVFYEEKANSVGAACKKAGRNIYKRAIAPRDAINSTADNAITPSGSRCSTKTWVAKKAKIAVRTTVNTVRILFATAKTGLDAALGAFEAAGAGALYALDSLCEEE